MDDLTEQRLQLRRDFTDFLEDEHGGQGGYREKLAAVISQENLDEGRLRLEVDMQDLQKYSADVHARVLREPAECIPPFEDAMEEVIRAQTGDKALKENQTVRVGFTGEFGAHCVSPRQLSSEFVSKLINVQGIVTRCSLVRPKVVKSVHYCETTGLFTTREYRDVTANAGLPTGSAYPTRDDNGNLLTTEYGLCTYRNHQLITVQELPETAPPGQLPRSADIMLEDDLVDSCKPGDRINVVGIYKAIPGKASGIVNGFYRAVVIACSLTQLQYDVGAAKIDRADTNKADQLAAEGNVLELLAKSLAPSIHGHDSIKKALILLLLGGRERNLANGAHLRGDINCLMVGDPGVAKSQLLRAVMNVSPLAVSTTGRGSSGVGLTAAVTTDPDTGERRLEAGAMVLADRGVVCIDEFDKMNDLDRVAIHEVMEQQTVTIAKAGIQTSLNARCSVVAAANPLYGTYDENISITRNINLPDSLLSRFDLLFIMRDIMDPEKDRMVAAHVVGQHQYRLPGDDGTQPLNDFRQKLEEDVEEDREQDDVHVKYDKRLHGRREPGQTMPLTTTFLKKYLQIAKRRCKELQMTQAAMDSITDFYTALRSSSNARSLPVTVRTLETIVRLSTAAAKCRLGTAVEVSDVEVAKGILSEVLDVRIESSQDEEISDVDYAAAEGKAKAAGWRRKGTRRAREADAASREQTADVCMAEASEPAAEEDTDMADAAVQAQPAAAAANAGTDMATVAEAVKAMMLQPGWSMVAPLEALVEHMQSTGVNMPKQAIIAALEELSRRNEEGMPVDIGIAYDAGERRFYEM